MRTYENEEINKYQTELNDTWERLHELISRQELTVPNIISIAIDIEQAAMWKGWNMGYLTAKGVEWR